MPRTFGTFKRNATVCLLRLTVAILCMKACATVAVILTANGAMKSNTTEYESRSRQIQYTHSKEGAGGRGTVRNSVLKAGGLARRLPDSMPSSSRVPSLSRTRKLALASPWPSRDKASSLLHSEVAQTPTTNTTTSGTSVSTAVPGSTTVSSTPNPFASTTTAAAVSSTDPSASIVSTNTTTVSAVPLNDAGLQTSSTAIPSSSQPPPPPVITLAASTTAPTQLPATLAPTPIPIPRWAQGGLLTMHGCECADSWQLNGLTLRGCVVSSDVRMPWCIVKDPANCKRGYTNSALPITPTVTSTPNPRAAMVINGTWDFCTLPGDVGPHLTLGSCHCLPLWEHGGVPYSGCNKTDPSDPSSRSWCYVAEIEGKCEGARRPDATRLQRWDNCDPPANQPSFLTKNSCHCKPRWTHLGKEYTSCIQDELVAAPANVNTTNTSIKKEMLGWCQVFEDERLCPNVELTETGVLWDTCFFLDEANRAQLPPTLHGCHCLPEWTLDGVLYSGCAWTPLAKASWCPVVEDESTCSNSLSPTDSEFGAGRGRRRWDWCSVTSPKDPSQPWRLAAERFTPKDPSPPAWYQNVYDGLIDSHNDWLDDRRKEQASYAGRRRIR